MAKMRGSINGWKVILEIMWQDSKIHGSDGCIWENPANTTYHMSIGMSPFKALYGYEAPTYVDQIFGESRAPKSKDWIQESQYILKALKNNLQTAQNQQKMYVDKNGTERNF